MTSPSTSVCLAGNGLPAWVPDGVFHYLAHIEQGQPIRALARDAGCHASTILRQVRRIETRRDDPLVDAALRRLGAMQAGTFGQSGSDEVSGSDPLPDDETLDREALRILRRLCETSAVLAAAPEMEKAVVVRDSAGGGNTRTAVVDTAVAQAMALKDWIAPVSAGRVVRYQITTAGRAALDELMAAHPGAQAAHMGFAEAPQVFEAAPDGWEEPAEPQDDAPRSRRMRYSLAESPLIALSRRRDQNGQPFLSDALVAAGERLREDFELAQMGDRVSQDWDRFLAPGASTGPTGGSNSAPSEARRRTAEALAELGPGLSDVVLRCCCYLEGLETAEKRLGWSARSGKVVLRIALMRLQRHYEETQGPSGPMIG